MEIISDEKTSVPHTPQVAINHLHYPTTQLSCGVCTPSMGYGVYPTDTPFWSKCTIFENLDGAWFSYAIYVLC